MKRRAVTLYQMPTPELIRYVAWLAAWVVEGERLAGRFRSPYRDRQGAGAASQQRGLKHSSPLPRSPKGSTGVCTEVRSK